MYAICKRFLNNVCGAGIAFFVWLAVVVLFVPVNVNAQAESSLNNRLDRLEREIIDLQQKIQQQRANLPASAGESGGIAPSAEERIQMLEGIIREQNGRIDDLQRQIQQMKAPEKISQGQSSLGQASQGLPPQGLAQQSSIGTPTSLIPTSATSLPPNLAAATPNAGSGVLPNPLSQSNPTSLQADTASTGAIGASSAIVGTESSDDEQPSKDIETSDSVPVVPKEQAHVDGNSLNVEKQAMTELQYPEGNPEEQFAYARNLLEQSNYEGAEFAFQKFVNQNPNSKLLNEAYYWLGETYFIQKKYSQAAATFAGSYKKFPKDTKAPDALLKLGQTLSAMNKKNDACATLTQLETQHPKASAGILQRVRQEQQKLGCKK